MKFRMEENWLKRGQRLCGWKGRRRQVGGRGSYPLCR